jgi:uncharacterized protein YodC (DUF2158 family)
MTMDPTMVLGQQVRLKSGGPVMAVEDIQERKVRCVWFDKQGTLHRDSFPPCVLEFALK